jgi:twitching motility protein PilI
MISPKSQVKIDYFQVEVEQSKQLAIPLEQTAEVFSVQRKEICPIPGVHPSLLGVINKRGQLLWILDFSSLLSISSSTKVLNQDEKLTTIILKNKEKQIGCVVKKLQGIIEIGSQEFSKVSWQKQYFIAETFVNSSPLSILDVTAVFANLQQYKN